jgi:hypothetical protein
VSQHAIQLMANGARWCSRNQSGVLCFEGDFPVTDPRGKGCLCLRVGAGLPEEYDRSNSEVPLGIRAPAWVGKCAGGLFAETVETSG